VEFCFVRAFLTAQKKTLLADCSSRNPSPRVPDQEQLGHGRVMYPSWRLLCQPEAAKTSNHNLDQQVQVAMIFRQLGAELRLALIRSSLRSLKRCSLSCEAIEIGGYC